MDLRSYGFFVACLAFAFWALSPFALPLGLGLVAAYTSEAPVDWLSARLQLRTPWGRRLLAPLFVAAVLIAGGLPAWGAVAEAWRELAPLVSSEGALNNFQAWLQRGLGILVARLEGMGLTIPLDAVLGEASGLGRHLAGGLAGTVGQFVRDTPARFLDFVLSHYVRVGVEELDLDKLTPLLKLKYHDSIPDAVADLGRPDEIGKVFRGFQRYLYAEPSA